MLYLILSMIFSSWWALSYKIALRARCSPTAVITVACAAATSLVFLWKLLALPFDLNCLSAVIGGIAGLALFIAIAAYFRVILGGARLGVSWTIITLSMIVPTSFSIFLWKEIPTLFQTVGLLFALTGIYLLGQVKTGKARLTGKEWVLLFTAFLLTGVVSLSAKLIVALGLEEFKLTYLLFLYGGALVPALGRSWVRKELPKLREITTGVGMGVAGVANLFFMLLALEKFAGTVVFPLKTCGSMLLTIFITHLVWHEELKKKEFIGLGFALLSIVLMNI